MPNVTVNAGNGFATLTYNVANRAFAQASQLASIIDSTFGKSGTAYNPASPPATPPFPSYLYDLAPNYQTIKAQGFAAVTVQNSGPTTVVGGGAPITGVLASNGGLTFIDTNDAAGHATTVVAGGGANLINFAGSKGADNAFVGNGNSTLLGGDNVTYFSDDGGVNAIFLGGGVSSVSTGGFDTVHLGSGAATVTADAGSAHDLIYGAGGVSNTNGPSLVFNNGSVASTVVGGAGRYDINAGVGGGFYQGAAEGANSIIGGTGAVTVFGGGQNDLIQGGSLGHNLLFAAGSNSTLVAGAGGNDTLVGNYATTFDFKAEAGGKTYTIYNDNFFSNDTVKLTQADFNSAKETVGPLSTTITLGDSTKITVIGLLPGYVHLST